MPLQDRRKKMDKKFIFLRKQKFFEEKRGEIKKWHSLFFSCYYLLKMFFLFKKQKKNNLPIFFLNHKDDEFQEF